MRHSEHYTPWHGHITALTVAPSWRRMGYARRLTESLERASDINDAWFVDLYVRESNKVAIGMYKGMGYASLHCPFPLFFWVVCWAIINPLWLQVFGIPTGRQLLQ
jgi:GNAT superfamily N-acetyltransferase